MDTVFGYIESLSSNYYIIVAALIVIGMLYLTELFCGLKCSGDFNYYSYGYLDYNGPPTWKKRFPAAKGSLQSPIILNEQSNNVNVLSEITPYLTFSQEFHEVPVEMKLFNNGHNVVIYGTWKNAKPTLSGGPLQENYHFVNLRFRWGLNDNEGSEHIVNCTRHALEIQSAFIKNSCCTDDVITAASCDALLMLSYIYTISQPDNPYLEPIITSLKYIKAPMGCFCIEPIVLSSIMPDFSRQYFYYTGSLTFPPCTEGVKWIVKAEPLIVSSRQVNKFRKLGGLFGRIESNNRPVQNVNKREIFYYD